MNEQPILIYHKNVDKTLNRILMPKKVVEMFGRKFYMKVYQHSFDKLILVVPFSSTSYHLRLYSLYGISQDNCQNILNLV